MRQHFRGSACFLMIPLGLWAATSAQDPGPPGDPKPGEKPGAAAAPTAAPAAWTTAVEPKPISPSVKRGLDWLAGHQLKDGGWGQGDESQQMGGGAELRDRSNVADTSIAALALIRSGSSPKAGPYKDAIARAAGFVRSQVEASDARSLDVSPVKGTRVQAKLGPNIDTFLASLFLAEVKGQMPEARENESLDLALNKVLGKIKSHQKADGSWDNQNGWAPILAQSVAGKGINRATQNGANVDATLLARTERFAVAQYASTVSPTSASAIKAAPLGKVLSDDFDALDVASVATSADAGGKAASRPSAGRKPASGAAAGRGMGGGMAGMGSAGVELYDRASSLAVLSDSVNSNASLEGALRKQVETSKDQGEVADAKAKLQRFGMTRIACAEAQEAVVARLEDKAFVSGFGSNGGEEFLSYMNIGESLVQKGGAEWEKWDASMTANLGRVQNDDGSWTGHHCITGRNFCTSTALLVLLGDRTPVPAQAKDKSATK